MSTYKAEIHLKGGTVLHLRNLESLSTSKNGLGEFSKLKWKFVRNAKQQLLHLATEEIAAVLAEEE